MTITGTTSINDSVFTCESLRSTDYNIVTRYSPVSLLYSSPDCGFGYEEDQLVSRRIPLTHSVVGSAYSGRKTTRNRPTTPKSMLVPNLLGRRERCQTVILGKTNNCSVSLSPFFRPFITPNDKDL